MAKYADTRSAGRSRLVPFRKDEDPMRRHGRRVAAAWERREALEAFCVASGISLSINNDGQHWRFVAGSRSADWWPSSAKLVVDRQWQRGIHVHDHEQVIRLLQERGLGRAP